MKSFVFFMEFFTIVSVVMVVVFQIFIPLGMGTPMFPFFRHKRSAAIAHLTEAAGEQEVNAIEAAAARLEVDQSTTNKRG